MKEESSMSASPWQMVTNCPGFGCASDCERTFCCEHHADCVESECDTEKNYCSLCGNLNEECICPTGDWL